MTPWLEMVRTERGHYTHLRFPTSIFQFGIKVYVLTRCILVRTATLFKIITRKNLFFWPVFFFQSLDTKVKFGTVKGSIELVEP